MTAKGEDWLWKKQQTQRRAIAVDHLCDNAYVQGDCLLIDRRTELATAHFEKQMAHLPQRRKPWRHVWKHEQVHAHKRGVV